MQASWKVPFGCWAAGDGAKGVKANQVDGEMNSFIRLEVSRRRSGHGAMSFLLNHSHNDCVQGAETGYWKLGVGVLDPGNI